MATTKKLTTVRVTQVFTISAYIGDMPAEVFAALVEGGLAEWNPHVLLGNTGWSCGEGGDWGQSQLEDMIVEVVEEEE
jgi:hypothetical protein